MQEIRDHFRILFSGNATAHYRYAMRQRFAGLRARCSTEAQLVFDLHRDVKAILRPDDDLTLKTYLEGVDDAIVTTLENYLEQGMWVVDVGANTGLYTMICAALVGNAGKVYAFEPVPWLAERVEENAKLNSASNVEVLDLAVGAGSDSARLYLSKGNADGWSSLYRWRGSSDKYIGVNVVTLDEWIHEYGIDRIDFLKIDVEGSELDVFLGASEALEAGLVRAILVEFNRDTQEAAGFSANDLRRSLSEYGYEWYNLPWSAENAVPVDWTTLDGLCDLIAIRRDDA